jgi:uncharacterized protein (DUF2236 family)
MTMSLPATIASDSPAAAQAGNGRDRDREAFREHIRWYTGNIFLALFAGALVDQVALPTVAAGVEATGRARYLPWGRAGRTAAADQLVFFGDAADSRAEQERLKRLHRDVKGIGSNGVRYSAFEPESWNWILISTFLVQRNAYPHITGRQLTPEQDQQYWDYFREKVEHLQLNGSAQLPENFTDMLAHYDKTIRDKAVANKTLDCAVETLNHMPFPAFLPGIGKPLWPLAAGAMGHIALVLAFGIIHPGVHDLTRWKWTRRHQIEFTALTAALRIADRVLPNRLTLTPLAYNRRQYERLVARYQSVGLTSFKPDSAACPVG